MRSFELLGELLLVAAVAALAARRLRIPYTVPLAVAGVVIGLFPNLSQMASGAVPAEAALVLLALPLLFEAALNLDLAGLRARWTEALVFGVGGTVLSIVAVGCAGRALFGLDPAYAFLFGAIVAPTDIVALPRIMRDAGVSRRFAGAVHAEGCIGTALAAAFFVVVAAGFESSVPVVPAAALVDFAIDVAGGLAAGALLGWAAHLVLARAEDPLTETAGSAVVAGAAYFGASAVGASGMVAALGAGLMLANSGSLLPTAAKMRVVMGQVWEVVAFVAAAAAFVALGLTLETRLMLTAAGVVLPVFVVLLVARTVLAHVAGFFLARVGEFPTSWRNGVALAGLRGPVPIALALALPAGMGSPAEGDVIWMREQTLAVVAGLVLVSTLVQGLTLRPALSALGLARRDDLEHAFEAEIAREFAIEAAGSELERLDARKGVPPEVRSELVEMLSAWREQVDTRIATLVRDHPSLAERRRNNVGRALLIAAQSAIEDAFRRGEISDRVKRSVSRELDGWVDEDASAEAEVAVSSGANGNGHGARD